MINEAYLVVQTIVNKEQNGYVSPSDYTNVAKLVQDLIFEDYFYDVAKEQNRDNRGLSSPGYGNLTDHQRERLAPFMTDTTITQATNKYALPADLYWIEEDGIITDAGNVVELMEHYKRGYVANSLAAPDETFPTAYRKGSDLYVLPNSYAGDLSVYYIRRPNDPQCAYTVDPNGDPLYDQANSTDFELHPSEFYRIVIGMRTHFGSSIREGEVIQVAESLKGQEVMKDNS